ncbi:helix-turn-helix transcriptional regulator [Paenibacillus silviterrae]|uniref:helix-turn-helix transcriptional regulator n=1 Tax=Paenibacillus silviterrae TaxID=3242194 RepID=UPI002542D790|nr:AraC family transcriptional regulator [Paenibacillus chinjuensis]
MTETGIISLELPPLPYYITTGHTTLQPGEQHPNRRNIGIFDLLWVTQGTLFMGEEDLQWEVAAGQTLLLLPEPYHYAVKPCDTETRFYWIHFDYSGRWEHSVESGGGLPYPIRHAWKNPYSLRLKQYASPFEFPLAERHLRTLLLSTDRRRSESFWHEQQLFMELLRLIEEGYHGEDASPALRLAERTEAYLRQHYQEELTYDTLAEALHYHSNYIVRCMKETYGCTPMEYLHEYRLEQAKLLLIKTNWPVARIAEQCGFQYAPYFSSCFKQYAGVSPLRFRKQYIP